MTFIFGKWRAVEELKAMRARYGENSAIMERDGLDKKGEVKRKGKAKKVEHPHPELLNKVIKVPVYDNVGFEEKVINPYLLTAEEKARNAKRHSKLTSYRIQSSK